MLLLYKVVEQDIRDDGRIYFTNKNNDNIQNRIEIQLVEDLYEKNIDYSILCKKPITKLHNSYDDFINLENTEKNILSC